jgi:hypothetical protein
MMFGDPFGREDEPGDPPSRGHARLACRVLVLVVGAGTMVGRELVGPAIEPFQVLALVIMGVLAVLSYVL